MSQPCSPRPNIAPCSSPGTETEKARKYSRDTAVTSEEGVDVCAGGEEGGEEGGVRKVPNASSFKIIYTTLEF